LPEDVDKDKISANYESGILKVNIPKNKEAKIVKQIKIS
jgi:HSP20 family molecular chaperone IbpA